PNHLPPSAQESVECLRGSWATAAKTCYQSRRFFQPGNINSRSWLLIHEHDDDEKGRDTKSGKIGSKESSKLCAEPTDRCAAQPHRAWLVVPNHGRYPNEPYSIPFGTTLSLPTSAGILPKRLQPAAVLLGRYKCRGRLRPCVRTRNGALFRTAATCLRNI